MNDFNKDISIKTALHVPNL